MAKKSYAGKFRERRLPYLMPYFVHPLRIERDIVFNRKLMLEIMKLVQVFSLPIEVVIVWILLHDSIEELEGDKAKFWNELYKGFTPSLKPCKLEDIQDKLAIKLPKDSSMDISLFEKIKNKEI